MKLLNCLVAIVTKMAKTVVMRKIVFNLLPCGHSVVTTIF